MIAADRRKIGDDSFNRMRFRETVDCLQPRQKRSLCQTAFIEEVYNSVIRVEFDPEVQGLS